MLRFFRTIRQNLLSENKAGKYLLYAVGEILLVVIGIIIAVQIGNWNQDIQNEKLGITSLENLREDLQIQREIIDEQITFESDMIAKADSALYFSRGSLDYNELVRLMYELSSRRTFIANKATFKNLEATGNIVFIKDKDLQNEIIRYYQQLDYTTAVITNNNLFLIDSIFGDFVVNNGMGFRSDQNSRIMSDLPLTPEQKFTITSQLVSRRSDSESLLMITETQLDSTIELIEKINQALEE